MNRGAASNRYRGRREVRAVGRRDRRQEKTAQPRGGIPRLGVGWF